MKHRISRPLSLIVAVVALAFLAGGCSQQAKAERDARDLADAVCDLRNATDAEAAQDALDDIDAQLDDINRRFGVATVEDRADISENLADLAEHAVQGNELLLQQDLVVLQRSAKNVKDDADQVQASAWTGFAEGLQECLTDEA